jgi:hypothetical protein
VSATYLQPISWLIRLLESTHPGNRQLGMPYLAWTCTLPNPENLMSRFTPPRRGRPGRLQGAGTRAHNQDRPTKPTDHQDNHQDNHQDSHRQRP